MFPRKGQENIAPQTEIADQRGAVAPKKTAGETLNLRLSRAMWSRFNCRLPERTSDTVLSLPNSGAKSR
jgi:hypothetical protein